jgi:hypothetical protein
VKKVKIKVKTSYSCECPACGCEFPHVIDNDEPVECCDCLEVFVVDWSEFNKLNEVE